MQGGDKRFPYPKWVWSPAGGWWPDPVHWKRNTFLAGIAFLAVCYPVFLISAENEVSFPPFPFPFPPLSMPFMHLTS